MALTFDGVDDISTHGDIAAVDSAANLSGCLWLRIKTGRGNNDPFISKGASNPYLFSLSGDVADRVQVRDAGRSYTTSSVTQDTWEWWGFVWNGGGANDNAKIQIYKNGVAETLTHAATWGATSALTDAGAGLVSIAGNSGSGQFTPCDIAHVKLWAASLSAAEMAQEYQSYRPQRTANLLLWCPFDDGTSVKDYSGAGNHGTLTGAVATTNIPSISFGGRILIG